MSFLGHGVLDFIRLLCHPARKCGACFAFAAAHAIEARVALSKGDAAATVRLAEMQAVVCAEDGHGGCKGGWVGQAYRYAATAGLVPSAAWATMTGGAYVESQYCPSRRLSDYMSHVAVAGAGAGGSSSSSSSDSGGGGSAAATVKIAGWETAPRTAAALMKVLANQPAVALVHAAPDWAGYQGGLYRGECSAAADDANHAVVVVGYTADAWIIKNSWGTAWGDGGFMLLPRGGNNTNKCGVLNSITYPVLDKVSPERRGELLRQGFCRAAGKVSLADAAAGNVSLAALAVRFGVPVNEMIRVNSHIQVGVDTPLELMTNYYIPPCTKEVPPQPVPKASCGTTYRIDALVDAGSSSGGGGGVLGMMNAFEGAGQAGRAAQAQHAQQLAERRRAAELQELAAFERARRLRQRRQLLTQEGMGAGREEGVGAASGAEPGAEAAAGAAGGPRVPLSGRRGFLEGEASGTPGGGEGSDPNTEPLPPTAWRQHWGEDYSVLTTNINQHRFPRGMNTSDYAAVATTRLLLLREAFPLLLSPDQQPIAAAARYGAGRVLVLGQREMWREFYQPPAADPTDTGSVARQLLANGFGWLAGYGRPVQPGDGVNATCYASGFAEHVDEVFEALDGLAAEGPPGLPSSREIQLEGFPVDVLSEGVAETGRPYLQVLVLTTSQVLAVHLQDAIRKYVAAGGGLLVVVHSARGVAARPNALLAPDLTFADFYSCNDLLGDMGILISPLPVEEAPQWRPPLPVPHPPPALLLLLNAEAAVERLRRYYAGSLAPGELSVEEFGRAVATMEAAKAALKPVARLFPRLFAAIAAVRGPPPPPQAPPSPPPPSPPPQGDDLSDVTRLGPVYTAWLRSYALEAISDYLDDYDVVCPRGSHVTGFKGRAWSTFDPAPWGATAGGMLVTEFALVCSSGKVLSIGYPTAPAKYDRYTDDPPYGYEGGRIPTGFTDADGDGLSDPGSGDDDDVAPSFGVDWSEAACPGGYDSVRVRPHSDDSVNFAKPLQMFFRCRDTGAFTTYTAGVGILKLSPDSLYDYDPDTWYITSLRNPGRGATHLTELQYLAQLEDVPGVAACPPGQALAGLKGSVYVPHVTDLFDPEPYDQFLAPTGPLINPGYTVILSIQDAYCRPVGDPAADGSGLLPTPNGPKPAPAPSRPPLPIPAPNGTAYLTSVTAAGLNLPGAPSSPPSSSSELVVDTVLTCGAGAIITGIVAAQEGVTDINYLGVRCSDGSGADVGAYHPSAESSGYLVDNPCLLGFDAVKTIGGRGVSYYDGSLGAGLGGFAVHCGSPVNEDGGGEAGSAWTRLGSAVLAGAKVLLPSDSGGSSSSSSSSLFALTEASINAPGAVCAPGQRIAALRVQVVSLLLPGGGGAAASAAGTDSVATADGDAPPPPPPPLSIAAVHFYCGDVPGPPKDRSFLDIATRYGITLSDLYGANPTLDRSQPVAAYNGTVIAVPQLCGAPPTQPPVTTIASGCSLWWPLPNITVTGTETCGDVARSFLRNNLAYLNTVNNGMCPNATTTIKRGIRMCIAPPASVCLAAYTVAVGDSCAGVAAIHGIEVESLLNWNRGLNCSVLEAGRELCVSKRVTNARVPSPPPPLLAGTLPASPPPPPSPPSPPPRPPAPPADQWNLQPPALPPAPPQPGAAASSPPPPRSFTSPPPLAMANTEPATSGGQSYFSSPPPRPPPPSPRPSPPPAPPLSPERPPAPPRFPQFPPAAPRPAAIDGLALAACAAEPSPCGPPPNACTELPAAAGSPLGYACACGPLFLRSADNATCVPLRNGAVFHSTYSSSHLRGVSNTDADYRFSSLWANDGADRSQDFQVTGGYFSSGRGDCQPWLSVDLGAPFRIAQVVLKLRPGGVGASRLGNAEVRVGLTPIRTEPDDRPGLVLNRLCGSRIATAAAPLAPGQDVVSVACGSGGGGGGSSAGSPAAAAVGQWVTVQNFHPGGELLQVAELEVYALGPALLAALGCGIGGGVDCVDEQPQPQPQGQVVGQVADGGGAAAAGSSPPAVPLAKASAATSSPPPGAAGPRITRLTNVTRPFRLGVSSLPAFASSSSGPDNTPEFAFDGIGVAPPVAAGSHSESGDSSDPSAAAATGFFQSARGDLDPFLSVDLGDQYVVSYVRLFNRADAYGNRLRNVSVWLADMPATDAASVAALVATAGSSSSNKRSRLCAALDWVADEGEVVQLNCTGSSSSGSSSSSSSRGRWVVVRKPSAAGVGPQAAGDEVLALAEVQVFGHRVPVQPSTAPPPPTGQQSLRQPPAASRRRSTRPPRRPPPAPKRVRVRISGSG
ncbi:hypothetical protein HYH02_005600 [Chlamydomonas schloesseri]|uniref:LysM domain-containing protein n=1 Tax=Chlamydomonas schloesseri TaxID=2026947 RepID=A0A836B754_9CHLO|nr:hypothetical protein HYH02_005600 [Chlamydomonas schloesseri]|eukprot:KAG2449453.1 hypothetical protein HYH02_005600 [Chlamydomonas schloesseri]